MALGARNEAGALAQACTPRQSMFLRWSVRARRKTLRTHARPALQAVLHASAKKTQDRCDKVERAAAQPCV
jgi:hypothetical protein